MADEYGFNLTQPEDGTIYNRDPATELESARTDALTFFMRGDYVNARIRANAALLIIATIPDGMIQGMASQTWNRPGITLFLEQLDKLESTQATGESSGMILQSYSYSGRRSC